jgi:hypothetical protein
LGSFFDALECGSLLPLWIGGACSVMLARSDARDRKPPANT